MINHSSDDYSLLMTSFPWMIVLLEIIAQPIKVSKAAFCVGESTLHRRALHVVTLLLTSAGCRSLPSLF